MKKILCIDDDPNIRLLIKTALEGLCEVVEAASGEEGLHEALRCNPSLILVDIMLPGLSGYDVVMKLRQIKQLKNTPVLAITAYGKSGELERARTLGFNDYIGKPFDIKKLKNLISDYLSGEITVEFKEDINPSLKEYSIDLIDRLQTTIEELKGEKRFTDSIIQCLGYGLLVLDDDGRVIIINPEGINILSHFVEDVYRDNISDFLGLNESREEMILKKGDFIYRNEIPLGTKDGEERVIGFSTAPRFDALGEKVGTIVSFRDITDLKRLQREMEKVNRLSAFAELAAAVAHEIRNPLAGIKTMAQAVDENIDEEDDNKEYIERIIRQVDRLNGLLMNFFTYSKPAKPQMVKVPLIAIMQEVKPLVDKKLKENDVVLIEQYEDHLPVISVDPGQIQQVFLNLVLNAMDAIGVHGRIEISAETVRHHQMSSYCKMFSELNENDKYIKVEVKDNGPGMTKDIVEKAFEPFFTKKAFGSGLGLAVVYRILQENNAFVAIESEQGTGTTVVMLFRTE